MTENDKPADAGVDKITDKTPEVETKPATEVEPLVDIHLRKKVGSLADLLREVRAQVQQLSEECSTNAERLDMLRNRVNKGPDADGDLW